MAAQLVVYLAASKERPRVAWRGSRTVVVTVASKDERTAGYLTVGVVVDSAALTAAERVAEMVEWTAILTAYKLDLPVVARSAGPSVHLLVSYWVGTKGENTGLFVGWLDGWRVGC